MRNHWVMIGVLALGACGKKGADNNAAGGAGSAAPTATAPAGSAAAGSAATGSAAAAAPAATTGCAILTKDEAAKLVGAEVEDGIESDEEGLGCLYNAKVGNDGVAIIIYKGDGAAKYDDLKKTEDGPVDVQGVGDHAYRTKAGAELALVAHGRCATIVVNRLGGKNPPPAPDVFADVGKAVAGRL